MIAGAKSPKQGGADEPGVSREMASALRRQVEPGARQRL
jgi:hypothetical protein